MKELIIKTQRQKRCLQSLIENKHISSLNLREFVGALNIYEIISQLRKLGWKIITTRFSIKDQDGILRKPGMYSLEEDHKVIAQKVIKEYVAEHSEQSSTTEVFSLKNNLNNTK